MLVYNFQLSNEHFFILLIQKILDGYLKAKQIQNALRSRRYQHL